MRVIDSAAIGMLQPIAISEIRRVKTHPYGTADNRLCYWVSRMSQTYKQSSDRLNHETLQSLVSGYASMVNQRVSLGWSCDLMTFMFDSIGTSEIVTLSRMRDEVERVYSRFVTRTHRRARTTPADLLPILIGAVDLPVAKRDRTTKRLVIPNEGLHCHGLLLTPPDTRLRETVREHFEREETEYCDFKGRIRRLHVQPVTNDHGHVLDYVLKTLNYGRLLYDQAMIVLPRVRSEINESATRYMSGFDLKATKSRQRNGRTRWAENRT